MQIVSDIQGDTSASDPNTSIAYLHQRSQAESTETIFLLTPMNRYNIDLFKASSTYSPPPLGTSTSDFVSLTPPSTKEGSIISDKAATLPEASLTLSEALSIASAVRKRLKKAIMNGAHAEVRYWQALYEEDD